MEEVRADAGLGAGQQPVGPVEELPQHRARRRGRRRLGVAVGPAFPQARAQLPPRRGVVGRGVPRREWTGRGAASVPSPAPRMEGPAPSSPARPTPRFAARTRAPRARRCGGGRPRGGPPAAPRRGRLPRSPARRAPRPPRCALPVIAPPADDVAGVKARGLCSARQSPAPSGSPAPGMEGRAGLTCGASRSSRRRSSRISASAWPYSPLRAPRGS